MNDLVSKSSVLDIYAELYDVFDDNKAIQEELSKVYDKLRGLEEHEPVKPVISNTRMSDRYLEHCMAVLRRSKEEAEDGVSCVLSVPEVDCIIDLLKEQEPVEPKKIPHSITCPGSTYICGNCRIEILEPDDNFCPNCGRAVKWDE